MSLTEAVVLDVRGLPIPQGSARAFVAKTKGGKPRAIVATEAHTNSPLGAWRDADGNFHTITRCRDWRACAARASKPAPAPSPQGDDDDLVL